MKVSIGEALARRKLKKITTGGGKVEGYVVGQYSAVLIGTEDAVVSYVDNGGTVCIMPCECIDGEWYHRGVMIRASQNFATDRNLPRTRSLNDLEVRAIQAALEKKAPAQPGQD